MISSIDREILNFVDVPTRSWYQVSNAHLQN